eukprot:GILK01012745.1.p1 GENE.GILK01012745.1~~GILK01012745.1.p1  ORF type:complete len:102 (-),score=8.73 GILK01012745.1:67-372(-)
MEDTFVVAHSWGNLLEAALGIAAIILHFIDDSSCVILAFTTAALSCYKTVLYLIDERVANFKWTRNNTLADYYFVFFIPLMVWVVCPSLVCIETGRQLMNN